MITHLFELTRHLQKDFVFHCLMLNDVFDCVIGYVTSHSEIGAIMVVIVW
jgi:hypothetical protein